MTPNNFSSKEFHHAILLNASTQNVFKHIATSDGITNWFVGSAKYTSPEGKARLGSELVQVGDRYHWKWLEKDFESSGEVLGILPGESVKMSFGTIWEVLFTITRAGRRSRLNLSQYYQEGATINEFAHLNCCVCWVFFLTNLKSIMEQGADLREVEVDDEVLVNR